MTSKETEGLCIWQCTCLLAFVDQSVPDGFEVSERREMLMRREIVEVADGFIFRGVAQRISPCMEAEGPQHTSNRLGCWTIYR